MGHGLRSIAVALLVAACSATGSAPPDPTPRPTVVPTAAASKAATPEPSVGRADYPYKLPWPADQLVGDWRYATTQWDGVRRVDHGDRYTDIVQTTDGSLFAFGYPTSSSAADFFALVAQQAVADHGCDAAPLDKAPLQAGGADGFVATYRCGSQTVLRWLGVHDGFALAVAEILNPTAVIKEAKARFKENVAKLVWS